MNSVVCWKYPSTTVIQKETAEKSKMKGVRGDDSSESEDDDMSIKEMVKLLLKENKKAKKTADKNFKELGEQIKSVAAVVEPLKDRMNEADSERGKMAEEIVNINDNIADIRKDLKKLTEAVPTPTTEIQTEVQQAFPVLGQAARSLDIFNSSTTAASTATGVNASCAKNSLTLKKETPLERAARTVSLFPITKEEVEEIEKELMEKDSMTSRK